MVAWRALANPLDDHDKAESRRLTSCLVLTAFADATYWPCYLVVLRCKEFSARLQPRPPETRLMLVIETVKCRSVVFSSCRVLPIA